MPPMPGMPGMPNMPPMPGMPPMQNPGQQQQQPPPMQNPGQQQQQPPPMQNPGQQMQQPMQNQNEAPATPNKTLFVENIPEEANDTMLLMLFKQYPGFIEVRLIAGRNLAFVDYETEQQAGLALQGLNGFQVNSNSQLKVTYARK